MKTWVWAALAVLVLAGCESPSGGEPVAGEAEFRSISGIGNNPGDPGMGEAHTPLNRMTPAQFSDGRSAPAGAERPSARQISNVVSAQTQSMPNARGASDFLWQWGQFLDHDLSLSPEGSPAEAMPIPVPPGDPQFDATATGAAELPFHRSLFENLGGSAGLREQINTLTAFIDASNVYGSDPDRALALRSRDGSGRLRTSAGELLPHNSDGLPNAPRADDATMFLAGDVRANEQLGLTAMHVLFLREHNRLADQIAAADPTLSGRDIYLRARALVGAMMQRITYSEFLPLLLGPDALSPYQGYSPLVDARLMNEFSTVAYRFGHSLVSAQLRRVDAAGATIAQGDLPLRDAFFAPQRLRDEGGIEPLLRGLALQPAQSLDPMIVDDLRNFLFGPPQAGGLDLAALNIQRGRDHGLPSYNGLRRALGLAAMARFEDITADQPMQQRLASAYGSVERIDPWVGGLAEDRFGDAMVGELFYTILRSQFERLRDGDRFWYQNDEVVQFTPAERAQIEATTLARVIRDNTTIAGEISDNVFLVAR